MVSSLVAYSRAHLEPAPLGEKHEFRGGTQGYATEHASARVVSLSRPCSAAT